LAQFAYRQRIQPERGSMDEEGHVLVIGAANLDIKGRPASRPVQGSSTPGMIRVSPGGVARNIAENLVRLDVDTVLLTAVGDDENGELLLGQAAGSGIDVSEALVIVGGRTGAYVALFHEDGSLDLGIDDMDVMSVLTSDYFTNRQHLFESAAAAAVDANLTPEAFATVVRLCEQHQVPLYADPTSSGLSARLVPHLSHLCMITPNVVEAQALSGLSFDANNPDAAMAAASHFVSLGVRMAVIALAEFGVAYADAETRGHIPALQTHVVDPTGAGDAMTAAIIFGLREDIPLDECVRLGVTAASLTLRSRESVRPDLSVDLLYDELVI
jgi:pseudouridine kinase